MTHYSVQSRDQIFIKGYGFLHFAKTMGANVGKNISMIISSKYNQKPFDHAKQSATNPLESASEKSIQKQQKQLVI